MGFATINRLAFAGILGLSLAAGTTLAQAKDEPALRGPRVKDGGVPGEDRKFAPGDGANRVDRERVIPHRMFMKAFDVLRGENAGKLRLDDKQEFQIKTINGDFEQSVEAYREQHRDEVQDLLKDLSPQDRRRAAEILGRLRENLGEDRPGAQNPRRGNAKGADRKSGPKGERPEGEEMQGDPKKAEAARERLRELLEGAPKPTEIHANLFAVLTQDQKRAVEQELVRVREEMDQRRDEMYKERQKKEIREKMDQNPEMDREHVRKLLEGLPASEKAKIREMAPEERRAYIRKLVQEQGKK